MPGTAIDVNVTHLDDYLDLAIWSVRALDYLTDCDEEGKAIAAACPLQPVKS